MTRRFLGTIFFLRHGQTYYTDKFPDLTNKGMETISKSANLIQTLLNGNSNVVIITSPAPRARGSAALIAKTIGYHGTIKKEYAIQGTIFKDKKKGRALLDEYMAKGGIRALDMAYKTDPRYEEMPNIIEPRSKIRKRFFKYFAKIIEGLIARQRRPLNLICVSHYEILYHFVEHFFELDYTKDEPLGHGEIIAVSIFDICIENVNVVELEITFRKETIYRKFFDYKEQKMR